MHFVSSHTIRRNMKRYQSFLVQKSWTSWKYYRHKEKSHGSPHKSHGQIIANSLLRKVTDNLSRKTIDIGPGNLERKLQFPRYSVVPRGCEHVSCDIDFMKSTTFNWDFYWWSRLEFVKKLRFPHATCIDRMSDRGTPKQRIAGNNWSHLSDLPLCSFPFFPSVLELWCDLSISENLTTQSFYTDNWQL